MMMMVMVMTTSSVVGCLQPTWRLYCERYRWRLRFLFAVWNDCCCQAAADQVRLASVDATADNVLHSNQTEFILRSPI